MLLSLLLLLLLYLLGCSSDDSSFLGTVMTYYPKNTNADGSIKVVLRYKMDSRTCTDFTWFCLSGDCGTDSVVCNTVFLENTEPWCQMEEISSRLVPSNAPFQLLLNGKNWMDDIINDITRRTAMTLVELRNRSDTGKANTSPQTTILPVVRVPSNCQRDFNLLAFDPDGDEVKCRYGNILLSECNPCTPPSVLSLSSSCTLSFSPTSSRNEGPYAVQLVMEDFPRQTITLTQTNGAQTTLTTNSAISKIPVQFVLKVDPVVPSCTDGLYLPKFLPPTPHNRAQLYTPVNQTLEINIKAEANITLISDLQYSGPYNINQTTLAPGQYILRWTPSQSEDGESHPICFVVQAISSSIKYHSQLRCVIVTVRNDPTLNTLTTSPYITKASPTTKETTTTAPSTTLTPLTTPTRPKTTHITTAPSTTTQLTIKNISPPTNTATSATTSTTTAQPITTQATTIISPTMPQTTAATSTTQLTTTTTNLPSISTLSSSTAPSTTAISMTTTQNKASIPSIPLLTLLTTSVTTPSTTTLPDTTTAIMTPTGTTTQCMTAASTRTTTSRTPLDTTLQDTTSYPRLAIKDLIQVVALETKISSLFPLSEEYINNAIIQQLKDELVRRGLPSNITLRIRSNERVEAATTEAPGG